MWGKVEWGTLARIQPDGGMQLIMWASIPPYMHWHVLGQMGLWIKCVATHSKQYIVRSTAAATAAAAARTRNPAGHHSPRPLQLAHRNPLHSQTAPTVVREHRDAPVPPAPHPLNTTA